MRLWHIDLLERLPRQQLLGQHRECCALRGNGWGRNHSTVNYVFRYPYSKLYSYHSIVMREMLRRGYKITHYWFSIEYRGKDICWDKSSFTKMTDSLGYDEHNNEYLKDCIHNLKMKGVEI